MAKNYIAEGKVIQYTAGPEEEVKSGDVLFAGGIPGVALVDIGPSETGSVAVTGVFEVPKWDESGHEAEFDVGAIVKWDPIQKKAGNTAGLPMLGYAFEAAGAGVDTVNVLLAGDPASGPVLIKAGEALDKYDLVYPSGYDADKGVIVVKKADADAADPAKVAWFVVPADIGNGELGVAVRSFLATDIDTDAPSAGDPVYLSATAGGWTHTPPATGGASVQQVGLVVESHATTGKILFLVGDSKSVTVNTTTE